MGRGAGLRVPGSSTQPWPRGLISPYPQAILAMFQPVYMPWVLSFTIANGIGWEQPWAGPYAYESPAAVCLAQSRLASPGAAEDG